jgi:hypothetical protein
VKVALTVGLALTTVAVVATLSGSRLRVAATNSIAIKSEVGKFPPGGEVCQGQETIPRRTSAIRPSLFAYTGPSVRFEAVAAGRVVARGERGSGWTGSVVTIPIRPAPRAIADVKICFALAPRDEEPVKIYGEPSPPDLAARDRGGEALEGRFRVEYLRAGGRSWWSLASPVARRMGFGHAAGGNWGVLLVIALVASVFLVASRLLLRELR